MKRKRLGQRHTVQREAIMAVIRASEGPLTIDQIHRRSEDQQPNLGIATVYRTVKLLLQTKLLRVVILSDGTPRYEAADLGHHLHFRCRVCHRVYVLELCPVALPPDTRLPGGFEVEGHELTLFGVCPQCAALDDTGPE